MSEKLTIRGRGKLVLLFANNKTNLTLSCRPIVSFSPISKTKKNKLFNLHGARLLGNPALIRAIKTEETKQYTRL